MAELRDPLEECSSSEALAGLHTWEAESLWPEQWLPKGGVPTGEPLAERARCVYCGVIGDIAETYPAPRGEVDLGF